jgi:hypothetical protein
VMVITGRSSTNRERFAPTCGIAVDLDSGRSLTLRRTCGAAL